MSKNVLFSVVDTLTDAAAKGTLALKRLRDRLSPYAPPPLNCLLLNAKGCPHASTPQCNYPTCYLLRDFLVPSRDATEMEILDAASGKLDDMVLEKRR